jgi:predicted DNA-binding antitoxin AbrB/MazE fold protein
MKSTIRARVRGGRLEPVRKLDLPEGSEVTLTLVEGPSKRDIEAALSVAGAWRGKVDARRLIRDIYASRLVRTRPEPRL